MEVIQNQLSSHICNSYLSPAFISPVINQDNSMVSAVPTILQDMVFAICRLMSFIYR